MATRPKTILFLPINSSGHLHSGIAVADRLNQEHGFRCVFILVGPPQNDNIQRHGHELVIVKEPSPLMDYELEEGEEPGQPVDEELKRSQGKVKRAFEGATRWTQLASRSQHLFNLKPCEGYKFAAFFCKIVAEDAMNNSGLVEQAVNELNPDLIISDTLLLEPCILKHPERPWIRLYSMNPLAVTEPARPELILPPPFCGFRFYTKEERRRLQLEEPDKWQALLAEWKQAKKAAQQAQVASDKIITEFYTKHGCEPPKDHLTRMFSPYLNIYMYPEALDYDQDDDLFKYPSRFLRCNSLIKPTGELENEQWSRLLKEKMVGRDSLVYFSLGTVGSGSARVVQRFVDNLAKDPNPRRLYVVSKGSNGDHVTLDSRNMIGGNYLPQCYLLQHAHVAIIHGGNNSTTECLHYGVPMVVLANFTDQLDNAQRVEDLGLGKRLDLYSCTSEQLVEAVDELCADQTLRERLREIGANMRQLDELGKVSAIVRELVEQKELSGETAQKCGIDLTS